MVCLHSVYRALREWIRGATQGPLTLKPGLLCTVQGLIVAKEVVVKEHFNYSFG